MSTTTARPRQTTMAGVMVMLGATFVVISVWDMVSRLRSLETREWIERFLADGPGGASVMSVESMIQTLHVIALLSAACAVAAVALGWQVLQRSTGARVALSVVAVPLFLTGLVSNALAAPLVAAATVFLWLSPSREWFAGLPLPEQGGQRQPSRMQVWEQTSNRDSQKTSGQAEKPASKAPVLGAGESSSASGSTGWSVSGGVHDRRPDAVTVALVLTIVAASIVFIMIVSALALLVSQPDVFLGDLRRQLAALADGPWTDAYLARASYLVGAVMLAWCAGAIALAFLMANRRAWAARGLMICAVVCAVLCIVAALVLREAVIPGIAAAATVSCLRRADVRTWFDGG